MEYAGLVVAAVVALVFCYLLPARIDHREAVVQSREIDRFSPGLRLVAQKDDDTARTRTGARPVGGCTSGEIRMLPSCTPRAALTSGGAMAPQHPRLSAQDAHRIAELRREASRLRTRRAARLSVEQAGVKRRLVLAGLLGVATVALVVLPAIGLIAWAWVAIPGALLAALVGYSAVVARHSASLRDSEAATMQDILTEISDLESGRTPSSAAARGASRMAGPASGAVPVTFKPVSAPAIGAEAPVAEAPAAEEPAVEEPVADHEDASTAATPVVTLESKAERPSADQVVNEYAPPALEPVAQQEEAPALADQDAPRNWSARPVPTPSYQRKAAVRRRSVHPDTDIKGFPAVDGSGVPARPVETSGYSSPSWSSEEVRQSLPVAFDLNDVLANRRAQ